MLLGKHNFIILPFVALLLYVVLYIETFTILYEYKNSWVLIQLLHSHSHTDIEMLSYPNEFVFDNDVPSLNYKDNFLRIGDEIQ